MYCTFDLPAESGRRNGYKHYSSLSAAYYARVDWQTILSVKSVNSSAILSCVQAWYSPSYAPFHSYAQAKQINATLYPLCLSTVTCITPGRRRRDVSSEDKYGPVALVEQAIAGISLHLQAPVCEQYWKGGLLSVQMQVCYRLQFACNLLSWQTLFITVTWQQRTVSPRQTMTGIISRMAGDPFRFRYYLLDASLWVYPFSHHPYLTPLSRPQCSSLWHQWGKKKKKPHLN